MAAIGDEEETITIEPLEVPTPERVPEPEKPQRELVPA